MSFNSFSSSVPDAGFQTKAVVKWFNLTKGFGFVAPADGSADAFLHSSVVNGKGLRDVAEGTEMLVVITNGPKGPQVETILDVFGITSIPQSSGGFGGGGGGHRPAPTGPAEDLVGTVKWFKPEKGFGFATPDDGGRDVFVHRSVLLDAGLQSLAPGQRLRMKVQTASKGREATSIEVVN